MLKFYIIILLIAKPVFSQKIWEVKHEKNFYFYKALEVPNSDLLILEFENKFIEIRHKSDGSLVNKYIKKQNESGEIRIPNTGDVYYYTNSNGSFECRNILTNELEIYVPEINYYLDKNTEYNSKTLQKFELYDNNTKLIGYLCYLDTNDLKNYKNILIIYNLKTNAIEYESINSVFGLNTIYRSYISPDDKYFIQIYSIAEKASMFNLQTKQSTEFKVREKDGTIDLLGTKIVYLLMWGTFQNDGIICTFFEDRLLIYTFPEFKQKSNDIAVQKDRLFFTGTSPIRLCGDYSNTLAYKWINFKMNYYKIYFIKFNNITGNIVFNSENIPLTFEDKVIYILDDCNKIIFNDDGYIVCYNINTLDIQNTIINEHCFNHYDDKIYFNSEDYLGQLAKINIYNNLGAEVTSLYNGIINQRNFQFQILDLPSGIYHLQCQLPSKNLYFNFVIIE